MESDRPDPPTAEPVTEPFEAAARPRKSRAPRPAPRKRQTKAVDGPAGGAEDAPPNEDKALTQVIEGNPTFVTNRRSHRDRVAEWVLLRSQGMKNADIAAKMGIQVNSLHTLVSKAVKAGWLVFESPADRLEFELAPMVVENVRGFLEAKDRQVTLEAAKGLGLFKTHQALKVEGDQAPAVIAIRIDMLEPAIVRPGGTIVGTPKLPTIEGRVVKPDGQS